MKQLSKVKPMTFGVSLWFFGIPAILLVPTVYVAIPYLGTLGFSEYMSYALSFFIYLILMTVAALAAYQLEGNPLTWSAFKERFRLLPMTGHDWLWTTMLFAVVGAAYMLFADVSRAMVAHGWLPLPAYIPRVIDPRLSWMLETTNTPLWKTTQDWWASVIITVPLLFANIIGEEFWWRGYILPRQELALGKFTWLVHGILWTLFHAIKYWDWLALLPICLGIAYMAQHLKNTWPGIITHFILNATSMTLLFLIGKPT
jgi:membrane protease YdiL (CAAX protease family)